MIVTRCTTIFIGMCLFACPLWTHVISQFQQGNSCAVEQFQLSDDYLVAWGEDIIIYISGQCASETSHLMLSANADVISENYEEELWIVLHTEHYPFGQLNLCVTAEPELESTSIQPDSLCKTVWLVDPTTHER